MKKVYEEPSVQILELMSADILLASGDTDIDVGDGWLFG